MAFEDPAVAEHRRSVCAARYLLLPAAARQQLDVLARCTGELLQAPVAVVSAVTDCAVHHLGQHGVRGWAARTRAVPVEFSFCPATVSAGGTHVIVDARADEVHRANPLVERSQMISYAGVALRDRSGLVIGTHCVIDACPRRFGGHELRLLQEAAQQVQQLLHRWARPAREAPW